MQTIGWIIDKRQDGFRVGRSDGDPQQWLALAGDADTTPAVVARQIAQTLKERGYCGEAVAILLPPRECLVAAFEGDDRTYGADRDGLLFRLEEFLPLSVEDVVADFISAGRQHLGVAIVREPLGSLVRELEAQDVNVRTISPAGLMAVQAVLAEMPGAGDVFLLWAEGEEYHCFRLCGRTVLGWSTAPDWTTAVRQVAVASLTADTPLSMIAWGATSQPAATLAGLLGEVRAVPAPMTVEAAAARTSRVVLAGATAAMIDLRRDGLAPPNPLQPLQKPLWAAYSSAVVFLVALIVAMESRGSRYERVARDLHARQVEVFRELFPGQSVPAGIRARLESEQLKISGLQTKDAEVQGLPHTMEVLRRVLEGVPESPPCRIRELRFTANDFDVGAEVRSHADGGALANALRAGGLAVPPPQTEQLNDRLVFLRLAGSFPVDSTTTRRESP